MTDTEIKQFKELIEEYEDLNIFFKMFNMFEPNKRLNLKISITMKGTAPSEVPSLKIDADSALASSILANLTSEYIHRRTYLESHDIIEKESNE